MLHQLATVAVPLVYTIAGICWVKPSWSAAAGPFFLAGSVIWLAQALGA